VKVALGEEGRKLAYRANLCSQTERVEEKADSNPDSRQAESDKASR